MEKLKKLVEELVQKAMKKSKLRPYKILVSYY